MVVLNVYLKIKCWWLFKFIFVNFIRIKVEVVKGFNGNLVVICFKIVVLLILIGLMLKLEVVWLIIGNILK